jgi:hypothetical protein
MRDSAWFMSSQTPATRETENLGSTGGQLRFVAAWNTGLRPVRLAGF